MNEKLAIHGGPKSIDKNFNWPIYDEAEVNAVAEIVASGKWGNPDCGDAIARFEAEFAAYCGSKYAITCVNGSVSLRLALIACGVKPGDEVIVPPYTFITTASSVIECNCVPVFVDIDPDTYNISPAAIEAAITPRTKVIIPVHFGGLACDMDAIMSIAKKYNQKVIEDAAHAHGAEYKGKKLGSIGHVGSFSFQSSKNLTSGEGGIVITDDDELYAMMHSLRNVGRIEGGAWYDHYNPGCNYRITQMQAVLLSEQLKKLEAQTRTRNENGLCLNTLLENIAGIEPLKRDETITLHCYHIYIFKYDPTYFGGLPKADFAEMLAAEGVPSFKGYPHPLYKQPLFQNKNFMCYAIPDHVDYTTVHCPEAEKACSSDAVWILQHAMLGDKTDMEAFANAILKIQSAMNV
ncbi:DegT/DnrJ/EryC1/StrS aminotransferase family protein [Dyadobacter sp. CY343]|uniref:DegT/DnrJ/EryC1/StrS family aminotransferase n=1 Tax=Dyadobacter sp. CY343 TaxID=2907299 RepID=UPI001F420F61|nr:DegT/DnrJ/EryC1/StrS family aminotransferase [Dyadobacter sp. CY343]MCE7058487.1 DegT/DnrJ/EryC1/StrS family aminotransferase [Dyadobacter sp. CY343]